MVCVATVIADILQGFGVEEGTLTMALDLEGAFNAVLLDELICQLVELEAPGRIINFINFPTTRRFLSLSAFSAGVRAGMYIYTIYHICRCPNVIFAFSPEHESTYRAKR